LIVISNNSISDLQWQQASLPISQDGLGIRRVAAQALPVRPTARCPDVNGADSTTTHSGTPCGCLLCADRTRGSTSAWTSLNVCTTERPPPYWRSWCRFERSGIGAVRRIPGSTRTVGWPSDEPDSSSARRVRLVRLASPSRYRNRGLGYTDSCLPRVAPTEERVVLAGQDRRRMFIAASAVAFSVLGRYFSKVVNY
jgi:hypothetical protein